MIPKNKDHAGYIVEFKKRLTKKESTPEESLQAALKQIREKNYATELKAQGVTQIWGLGIVIEGKKVWLETESLG